MLDADDAVELRALQARAYGRTGGLSPDDERRLAELTARRADASVSDAPAAESDPGGAAEDAGAAAESARRRDDAAEPRHTERTDAVRHRRRWWIIAVALVVVFGLGAAAGWFLSRPAEQPVELSAGQAEWQQELIDGGEYDPGSIRAVAVEDDVAIWVATQSRGLQTCLVLGDAEERVPSCTSTDFVRSSGFEAVRTVDGGGELLRQVSARLFLTAAGEPAVVAGSYLYGPVDEFGSPYRNDEETATAEKLVAMGLDRTTLRVVGYDDETPIWVGMWTTTGQTCMVYDGSEDTPYIGCDEAGTEGLGGRGLAIGNVDEETGEETTITFTYGDGPSYLQITREPAPRGEG